MKSARVGFADFSASLATLPPNCLPRHQFPNRVGQFSSIHRLFGNAGRELSKYAVICIAHIL